MELLGAVLLLAATLATGLVAGVFALYQHTVMPGLGRTDDRTFVAAFAAVDRAIINPWFIGGGFLGAPLLMMAAAVANREANVLVWIVAALASYVVAAVITVVVNVPLNDALKAAGLPEAQSEVSAVRARFDEARWQRWNLVRVLTTLVSFAALAWALVEYGAAGVSR